MQQGRKLRKFGIFKKKKTNVFIIRKSSNASNIPSNCFAMGFEIRAV